MEKNISLIGGDLRIINLAEMLEQDGNKVTVYGMEKSEEITQNKNIKKVKSIGEAISNSEIIIGSIPFASDESKMYATFSEKDIRSSIDKIVLRKQK